MQTRFTVNLNRSFPTRGLVTPKNRDRFCMTMDILSVINSGVEVQTRIQYDANLSYMLFTLIIDKLELNGFVKSIPYGKHRRYTITYKGQEALTNYLALKRDLALEAKQ